MNDREGLSRLIDEINDMIENIDKDFPLLDFNSRYMMERGMHTSLMLSKALQKERERVMTNADRIRAMTDEELASYLALTELKHYPQSDITEELNKRYNELLDWLRKEDR